MTLTYLGSHQVSLLTQSQATLPLIPFMNKTPASLPLHQFKLPPIL